MFYAISNPKYYSVCKYLYCVTFLRGTFDSLSFWLVDTHARNMVVSLYKYYMIRTDSVESQTNDILMQSSIGDYLEAAGFHVAEVGVGVDGKSINLSSSMGQDGGSSMRYSNNINSVSSGVNMSSVSSSEMFNIDPIYGFAKP